MAIARQRPPLGTQLCDQTHAHRTRQPQGSIIPLTADVGTIQRRHKSWLTLLCPSGRGHSATSVREQRTENRDCNLACSVRCAARETAPALCDAKPPLGLSSSVRLLRANGMRRSAVHSCPSFPDTERTRGVGVWSRYPGCSGSQAVIRPGSIWLRRG